MIRNFHSSRAWAVVAVSLLLGGLAAGVWAHEPDFTMDFDREGCTFTSAGGNAYFPLWPGYSLLLEGIEEDEGELVEISSLNTVLTDTELVDGVLTRVYEEREWEDDELVEVARNFVAVCRETGDLWYFGEDVDIYEDGEIVSHDGAWRAGIDGAEPGVLMPGSPMIGARYFEEFAPGVAEDQGEIVSMGDEIETPAGTFSDTLGTVGTNPLDPGSGDEKFYAKGVGNIVDETLELVEITLPPCLPDANTLCLNDGRFEVKADWTDFEMNEGDGTAVPMSADSGEFYFFSPDNTELLVKVLDACDLEGYNSFWVFAAGMTNVELTIEVRDTQTGALREYDNDLGVPFEPVLDTAAFATCP